VGEQFFEYAASEMTMFAENLVGLIGLLVVKQKHGDSPYFVQGRDRVQ
jgi:hypothetical protein